MTTTPQEVDAVYPEWTGFVATEQHDSSAIWPIANDIAKERGYDDASQVACNSQTLHELMTELPDEFHDYTSLKRFATTEGGMTPDDFDVALDYLSVTMERLEHEQKDRDLGSVATREEVSVITATTSGDVDQTWAPGESYEWRRTRQRAVADTLANNEQARTLQPLVDNKHKEPQEVPLSGAQKLWSVDLLGGDREERAWQEDAKCAETDPEAFFPEKGGSTREAKKVCMSCEVREECLKYALDNDERFGIWGGLTERERRKLNKRAL
jgi:WhiB family transcriptional regulator, redox-sensing transcriptional regulator